MWDKASIWLSPFIFLLLLLNPEACKDTKKNIKNKKHVCCIHLSALISKTDSCDVFPRVYFIRDHGFGSIPSVWDCRSFSPWNPGTQGCVLDVVGFAFSIAACFCHRKFFRSCKGITIFGMMVLYDPRQFTGSYYVLLCIFHTILILPHTKHRR